MAGRSSKADNRGADLFGMLVSGKGKDFESGKLELNDLYEIAKDANEISPESGKQELFENILNQYI